GGISSAAVTPDGRAVVTTSLDGTLRTWDPVTGRELRRREVGGNVFSVPQVLPDGRAYLRAGDDKLLRVHDLHSGKELAVLRGHTHPSPFALAPDYKTLASWGSDKVIRLLDPATGKPRHTLLKVDGYSPDMAFTADGRLLIVWSPDW